MNTIPWTHPSEENPYRTLLQMNKKRSFNIRTRSSLTALWVAVSSISGLSHAATLIDDFSDASLAEYTLTRVNDPSELTANVSFSSLDGALMATYTGTGAPEQLLYLRNDFSLPIGQMLTVDVSFAATTTQMDLGLAIAGTSTPTAVVTTGDTRASAPWLSVSVRPSQDSIRVNTSGAVLLNGSLTEPTYNPALVTTGFGVMSAVETDITRLFIQRTLANQFVVGYFDTSAIRHDALTVEFIGALDLGAQVGFYADLRAAGTLGTFDNLQVIPEPTVAWLGALSGLSLLRRRRL
jgi:hypothetical protein